jgi:hypothetical protein
MAKKAKLHPPESVFPFRKTQKKSDDYIIEISQKALGEAMYKSAFENIEKSVLDTPFGSLSMQPGAMLQSIKSKNLLYELHLGFNTEDLDDPIERLVWFKKLQGKFPNEPYPAYEVGKCYSNLKKDEQYEDVVFSNFEQFNEFPLIDCEYYDLMYEENKKNHVHQIYDEEMNLHTIYPARKAFDFDEINAFYSIRAFIFTKEKNFEMAQKCLQVLEKINSPKTDFVRAHLKITKQPWIKWLNIFALLLIVVAVLALIGGLIWGIVKLFQWVF